MSHNDLVEARLQFLGAGDNASNAARFRIAAVVLGAAALGSFGVYSYFEETRSWSGIVTGISLTAFVAALALGSWESRFSDDADQKLEDTRGDNPRFSI